MLPKFNFDIIEDYIKQNRLSQKEFCKRCRISTPTFYKIKKNQDVRLNALFKIAREIKRQVADLFEECPDDQK